MNNELVKALESIYRILNSIEYECSSSIYTLDDDEMSFIFYCKDLAFLTIEKYKHIPNYQMTKFCPICKNELVSCVCMSEDENGM